MPVSGTTLVTGDPTLVFAETFENGDTRGGVLADNGGRVQTVALLADPSNPALDAVRDEPWRDTFDEDVFADFPWNGDDDITDVFTRSFDFPFDARGEGRLFDVSLVGGGWHGGERSRLFRACSSNSRRCLSPPRSTLWTQPMV